MIALSPHAEGIVLPVRAQPGSRKQGILGEHNGALKVAVHAPPERGKANKAVVEVLAKALAVKRSQIQLLSGEASQDKRFLVRGVRCEELAERIAELLGGTG